MQSYRLVPVEMHDLLALLGLQSSSTMLLLLNKVPVVLWLSSYLYHAHLVTNPPPNASQQSSYSQYMTLVVIPLENFSFLSLIYIPLILLFEFHLFLPPSSIPVIWPTNQYPDNHFLFFRLHSTAYKILVPWPWIESWPLTVKAQSPNHWTVKEFSILVYMTAAS